MSVTRFNPFREMNEFRRGFDQLNTMLSSLDSNRGRGMNSTDADPLTSFSPSVNTREGKFAYHVEVDLPGVKKEDIDINVHDNRVTLSGDRMIKSELKEDDYYKIESSYGKFERSFFLPEDSDVENIHAETSDGVLELVIPKMEVIKETPKKIEIA